VEDALTFVRREARRGNQYNALVLDPPRFGRGPDGEIWRFEDSLPELLGACARILSTRPVFALLNVYATVLTEGRMERDAGGLHARLKTMLGESRIAVNAGALAIQDAEGRRHLAHLARSAPRLKGLIRARPRFSANESQLPAQPKHPAREHRHLLPY